MKKYKGAIGALFVVFLLACLILPVGTVYAETPVSVSTVLASVSADGIGSPFQHHSFIDNGINWVFYQDNISNLIEGMWSNNGVTWVALAPIRYCNGSTATTVGGQFDTWYDEPNNVLHFAVVNKSVVNSSILYGKFTPNPTTHVLTQIGSWVTAVAANASFWYRNPTICVNGSQQPFITYTKQTALLTDADVYLTTTNNSAITWVAQAGMPMHNLSKTANYTEYGSVIPFATDTKNVSVQYAYYNGSRSKLYQTDIEWNGTSWNQETSVIVDTSSWYLPSGYEWDYNAVSIVTDANVNDVAIQCLQSNGTDARTFFNRKGADDAPAEWNSFYARNFGEGATDDYLRTGAMSIRNSDNDLVYSSWNENDDWISSNDYDTSSGYWDGIQNVYNDPTVPYWSTMADYHYDHSGTGDVGFIYGSVGGTDDLRFGLYGPPVIPPAVTGFINATGTIVSLLISFLLIVLLLGIALKEGYNNGWNEATKIAITGIIGIIVIETIIIAFF